MTISTEAPRIESFAGAGSTGPFTVDWRVFATTDIVVKKLVSGTESTLTVGDDYTIELVSLGQEGASVTLTANLAIGETLFIETDTAVKQETQYRNLGNYRPENHEDSFDKLTAIIQEVKDILGRCIKIPSSDETGLTVELPTEDNRATYVLTFDANGNVTVGEDNFASLAAAAAASAAAAAASAAEASAIAAEEFGGLTDVTLTTPAAGHSIQYDGAEWVNVTTLQASTLTAFGDADTIINFGTADSIIISAGGVEMVRFVEDTADVITFNNGGADVDFVVKDSGGNNALAIDAGTGVASANKIRTWIKLGSVETVADGDYTFLRSVPQGFSILNIKTESSAGTCTLTVKINTTALGGTANSVSTSPQTQAHASANAVSADDDIVGTVSSNSGCTNMVIYAEIEGAL